MSMFARSAVVVAMAISFASPVVAQTKCAGNANALGITRTVEIDTTGGPGFGLEH